MYKALEIAKWFINYNDRLRNIDNEDTDDISNLKLQKLLYYAQGVVLALKDTPLFNEDFVAWTHGPVIKSVYKKFEKYGSKGISEHYKDVNLDENTSKILILVYNEFAKYSAWGLRNMTLKESPYLETEKNDIITIERIKKHFKENFEL